MFVLNVIGNLCGNNKTPFYVPITYTSVFHRTFPDLAILRVILYYFYHAATALVGQGLLFIEASRSHSDTPQSVALLWTSDQPDAETST